MIAGKSLLLFKDYLSRATTYHLDVIVTATTHPRGKHSGGTTRFMKNPLVLIRNFCLLVNSIELLSFKSDFPGYDRLLKINCVQNTSSVATLKIKPHQFVIQVNYCLICTRAHAIPSMSY